MFDLVGVGCNIDASDEIERLPAEVNCRELGDSLERQLSAFKLNLNLRESL